MPGYLKTSDIARQIGVHPNTVRLYEAKGYLAPVPRSPSGYRRFTRRHLEQMRLAHLVFRWPHIFSWRVAHDLVRCAADGDLGMAMELAYEYLILVRIERTRAEAAVEFMERWARGQILDTTAHALSIGQTAARLGLTTDQLRNWDRSGLLDVPRDPEMGYRRYRAGEIGRLRVIRMLRQMGFSLMAILRMVHLFDAGETEGLREVLDSPEDWEEIGTAGDGWLTSLEEREKHAQAIIRQLIVMINADPD